MFHLLSTNWCRTLPEIDKKQSLNNSPKSKRITLQCSHVPAMRVEQAPSFQISGQPNFLFEQFQALMTNNNEKMKTLLLKSQFQ